MDPGEAGNAIFLVGGQHTDWATRTETITRKVWQLMYDIGNHSYYWYPDGHTMPDMGNLWFWNVSHVTSKYCSFQIWLLGSLVIGVPDTFFDN